MSKRINTLSESPCYKCDKARECMDKIRRNRQLMDICDTVLGNAEFDYNDCPIHIAIVAPDMVEED